MDCCYEGCRTRSSLRAYMLAHRAKPHYRCCCGWVGPYPRMHEASIRKVGDTNDHYAVPVPAPEA